MCELSIISAGGMWPDAATCSYRHCHSPRRDHLLSRLKCADGLPLYREGTVYARPSSYRALADGQVGFELEPLAKHALRTIKQGERIFVDETTLSTLTPRADKAKTPYLCVYVWNGRPFRGSDRPIMVYRFEDRRAGDRVSHHLEGYRGILQVGSYTVYRWLAQSEGSGDPDQGLELLLAAARRASALQGADHVARSGAGPASSRPASKKWPDVPGGPKRHKRGILPRRFWDDSIGIDNVQRQPAG